MILTTIDKNKLFEKYNINPDKISSKENFFDKEAILAYLLYGYELARNNSLKGSLTKSSFATGLILNDKSVHFGVNFNSTRNEISSICAERMAILEAYNSKVKEYNTDINQGFDFEIEYILISSYREDNLCYEEKITPCADCLSWFNTGKYLKENTKIVAIKKDEKGELYIFSKKLSDFLPLRNENTAIIEYTGDIKILKSENAKKSKIKEGEIIKLYKKTFEAYKSNTLSETSGQNIAAGALINGEIFTGKKIDFSKRWFVEPLMAACYKGIEKYLGNTKIDAMCYIGVDTTTTETGEKSKDGVVSIKTIGRLNTKYANNDTLVISASDKGIMVRTIGDYMPGEHKFIHNYEIK